MLRFIFILLALLPLSARAQNLQTGALPLMQGFAPPLSLTADDQLVISGTLDAESPQILVLRIDDTASTGYATRLNDERRLPPGPFSWKIALKGAKTSGGHLLDASSIKLIGIFAADAAVKANITAFRIEPAPKLPRGALGLSFGAADAPLFAGFERVTAQDPRLIGGHPVAIRRPGTDPLLSSGLRGLDRIHLDLPPGPVHLSLWTEDLGEWETLPNALNRRIRVNGRDLLDERLTPQQWLKSHYLAGENREAPPDFDPWQLYGARRGSKIESDLEIGASGLTLELAGDTPVATYLSALLIEPGPAHPALDMTLANQAELFRSYWRRSAEPDADLARAQKFTLPQNSTQIQPLHLTLAPGSGGALRLALLSPDNETAQSVELALPALADATLDARLFAAQWRAERTAANANLLVRWANLLRSDLRGFNLTANDPRLLTLWVNAPENAKPGSYSGKITLAYDKNWIEWPLEVEVLPVNLPSARQSAGFYLDEAPHLTYFAATKPDRDRQIACDLAILHSFGLDGSAPPLSTPQGESPDFIYDSEVAQAAGLKSPWLAYTPAKRAFAQQGLAAAALIAQAERRLDSLGIPAPMWSIADEPSNPDQNPQDLARWAEALKAQNPGIHLAGHLNNPADQRFLSLFDTVLINAGFGLDLSTINALKQKGKSVWLYNTDRPRLTAGAWLWRSNADHYLQWHARMPTADPYDPTDGREGDVQMFYPTLETCSKHQPLGRDLLLMAEGVNDQRWLNWLDVQTTPQATALKLELERRIGDSWAQAQRLTEIDLEFFRSQILELAQKIGSK